MMMIHRNNNNNSVSSISSSSSEKASDDDDDDAEEKNKLSFVWSSCFIFTCIHRTKMQDSELVWRREFHPHHASLFTEEDAALSTVLNTKHNQLPQPSLRERTQYQHQSRES